MAALSEADRQAVYKTIMDQMALDREPQPLTKAQLRAVVDAMDTWIDGNTTSFNTSIPQPQRNALTARQKALIFAAVVLRRFVIQ